MTCFPPHSRVENSFWKCCSSRASEPQLATGNWQPHCHKSSIAAWPHLNAANAALWAVRDRSGLAGPLAPLLVDLCGLKELEIVTIC